MSKKITPVTQVTSVLGGKLLDVSGSKSHDHGLRMQREEFLLKQERKKQNSTLSTRAKLAEGMKKLTDSSFTVSTLRRVTSSSNTLVLKFSQ